MLGLAVRAIAGDGEVQVTYAPGKPQLDDKLVQLPEPSRVPSAQEIAVVRGLGRQPRADGGCHDKRLHTRLMPKSGPARAVFRGRWSARASRRSAPTHAGMAKNLTARVEDQYGHGR